MYVVLYPEVTYQGYFVKESKVNRPLITSIIVSDSCFIPELVAIISILSS